MDFIEEDLNKFAGGHQFLNAVRDLFLREPDDQVFIWDFSHEARSDILVGNQDFRPNNAPWWITIIDPYRGRRPILLNRKVFLNDPDDLVPITIKPKLLLDSQVVNALYTYVESPLMLDASKRESIRSFLSYITLRPFTFDLSPMFYFIETAAKSDPEDREEYMRGRAEAIFKLWTMDKQQFMQTGQVIHNPELVVGELIYNDATSIDELISRHIDGKPDALAEECTLMVDFKYASLLKIALVQYQMRGNVLSKYYVVREFMDHTLGLVSAIELMLALSCFTHPQRYQRFIRPLQPEMRFTKFRHELRASAWDLFLIWLAPRMLGMPDFPTVGYLCRLGYMCTAENALRDIMSSQSIIRVMGCGAGMHAVTPMYVYNLEMLGQILADDALHAMMVEELQWQRDRLDDPKRKQQISADALADVIAGLEAEAAAICQSGS
jgi:hypothetical protein